MVTPPCARLLLAPSTPYKPKRTAESKTSTILRPLPAILDGFMIAIIPAMLTTKEATVYLVITSCKIKCAKIITNTGLLQNKTATTAGCPATTANWKSTMLTTTSKKPKPA